MASVPFTFSACVKLFCENREGPEAVGLTSLLTSLYLLIEVKTFDAMCRELATTVYATYWTTAYPGPQLRISNPLVGLNCRYVKAGRWGRGWGVCVLRTAYYAVRLKIGS